MSELEIARLSQLNYLKDRRVKLDGNCAFCGFRAASAQLCDVCERRRQALAHRYPGVSMQRIFQQPEGMTRLYEAAPKEWLPYPSEE